MDEHTRQAARLWTTATPAVSAFIAALVRDFQDRDDVLQNVAVAVLESFPKYDTERPFLSWALGIARNQVHQYYRRMGRDRLTFDNEAIGAIAEAFEDEDPHALELHHLRECFQALDARSREYCRLRYELDLKPAAIGSQLGVEANTVAKTLQRVRDRLRECLTRKRLIEEAAR
ncbi:MAG: sigma-70 family RNA polymerase sigma factor [Isosphaeraceae bacterium]